MTFFMMKFQYIALLALVSTKNIASAFQTAPSLTNTKTSFVRLNGSSDSNRFEANKDGSPTSSRAEFFRSLTGAGALVLAGLTNGAPLPAFAAGTVTTITDGNLSDLPPDAARSYLQYRAALQISADFYMFELQRKILDIDDWGEVNQLFTQSGARGGQGQPNRIERDFTNPMRILGLSMPPDESEEMRAAQYQFERAMGGMSKATAGVRRDLPVELDPNAVKKAEQGWEEGRVALNKFFAIVNETTGLPNELKPIPPGPYSSEQIKAYGRSPKKVFRTYEKDQVVSKSRWTCFESSVGRVDGEWIFAG
mmetsp:Transcript_43544/g.63895  ORF Transcript_43544/g.63895 Transcript_43544/m.63895 type:complete len:309 (-) Transcript_43544:455-1381(-)